MDEQPDLDASSELNDEDILELEDEEGNLLRLLLLAMVDVEGKPYAVAVPHEQFVSEEEEGEIHLYLFAYIENEGEAGAIFAEIEDEETYNRVRAACEALLEM